MSAELKNKVAIITGGTSGIGRETALLFSEAGAKVVVAGRRDAEGNEVVEKIRKSGGEAIFVKTDVAKSGDAQALVRKTVEKYGRLDAAFNNAGIEGDWLPLTQLSEEQFDRVMDINVKGMWLCLKYEIPEMIKAGGGTIVNMSSVAGLMGIPGAAHYTASKHSVIALTRTAALECGQHKIRVNAVCPGVVETPMADRAFPSAEIRKALLAEYPIGRFAAPREIAEAVLWLSSDGSSFMTGHYIVLDGGRMAGPNPRAM